MGSDFRVVLDRASGTALHRQIRLGIEEAIDSAALAAGDRLPAARVLARTLGVNPDTVVHAYRDLSTAGLVRSKVGSGTYVVGVAAVSEPAAGGGCFPMAVLRGIIDEVLDEAGATAFAAAPPGGHPPLRQALCTYLEAQGFELGNDETIVFSGAQQGLSLVVRSLLRPGDWVLVESPTYPGVLRLLRRARARVETVPIGPDGPDVTILQRLFRTRPFRMAYVMPTHHHPTGVSYPTEVKESLHALCGEHRVLLVEDDGCSDLDYGSGRQYPLRAVLPTHGNCLYLKSFSHLLLPGFRLGCCLCPAQVSEQLRRAKEEADLFTSGFFQRVLHRFLVDGHLEAHVRHLQDRARVQLTMARDALDRVFPAAGISVCRPDGGTNAWCSLPSSTDADTFFAGCTQEGLPVRRGSQFTPDDSLARSFALSFAGCARREWDAVAGRVAELATLR